MRNLLRVSLRAPRILRLSLHFWKICASHKTLLLPLVINFMHGIYNYTSIPATKRVSRVYSVAGVLCLEICATRNAISHVNCALYRRKYLICNSRK